MPKGRPPDLLFDPDHLGPAIQVAAHVDDRGRLQLPRKIVGTLAWISKSSTTDALAVLTVPGVIRLHPWQDAAPAVLERRRQLIQQAAREPAALEMLRTLEDRYKRFQIPLGARPTLTSEMILHLGASPFTPTPIYVWRLENIIELTSIVYRNQPRDVNRVGLADFPH